MTPARFVSGLLGFSCLAASVAFGADAAPRVKPGRLAEKVAPIPLVPPGPNAHEALAPGERPPAPVPIRTGDPARVGRGPALRSVAGAEAPAGKALPPAPFGAAEPRAVCSAGITLVSGLTHAGTIFSTGSGGTNTLNSYTGCTSFTEAGPDIAHMISVPPGAASLVVDLSWGAGTTDLDLVVLSPACDSTMCVGAGTLATGTSEQVYLPSPAAGYYYVVVENYSNITTPYELTATVGTSCGGGFQVIDSTTIGTTLSGDTSVSTDTISSYYGLNWQEAGPEAVYQYTVPAGGTHDLRAYLTYTAAQVDLDVFILMATCDSNQLVAFGDTVAILPSAPAGTYYIVVDTYSGPGTPSTFGGPYQLTVADATGLLVVDDDGTTSACTCGTAGCSNTWGCYSTALTSLGETSTTWDVVASGAVPSKNINNARQLMWINGSTWSSGTTLTAADQANLRLYLALGGRLFLEGQDILFDLLSEVDGRVPDGTFVNDDLAVNVVDNDIDKACHNCPVAGGATGSRTISGVVRQPAGYTAQAGTICFRGPQNGSVAFPAANPAAYSIPNLPDGIYRLSVSCGCVNTCGAGPDEWNVTVSGGNVTNVDFELMPGRSLTGALGNPIGDDLSSATGSTPFDLRDRVSFPLASQSAYNPFTDALTTRVGEPIFFTRDRRPAGVMVDGSNSGIPYWYKAAFFAFSPVNQADSPAGTRATQIRTLTQRSLAWLRDNALCNFDGHLDVAAYFTNVTAPAVAYPRPGDTVTFTVDVTNYDSVSRTVDVYFASQDRFLTLTTPSNGYRSYGAIASGATASQDFTFTVSPLTPEGHRILPSFSVLQAGAYCFSQGFGLFVGQPDVMLVKDELIAPNTTGIDEWGPILTGLGYSYALWDTSTFLAPEYDSPSALDNDLLKNYGYTIWTTGPDFFWTLTPTSTETYYGINPEAELTELLGAGGRLVLVSQDYLWDRYADGGCIGTCSTNPGEFAYDWLRIASLKQDVVKNSTSNLDGKPGTWPTEYSLNTLGDLHFPNYSDGVTPRASVVEAKGWGSWTNYANEPTGVAYLEKNVTGKVAFLPFAFENLADNPPFYSKSAILQRVLCQMQMTPASTNPPCAWYAPAPVSPFPTLYGVETGGNGLFTWADPDELTCTEGRPIYGRHRVRGAAGNPNPASFATLTLDDPPFSYTATQTDPGPVKCWFYEVDTYVDDFGVAATTCP